MEPLIVRNPFSGEELGRVDWAGPDAAKSALDAATRAFVSWRRTSAFERSRLLETVAAALEDREEEFAQLIRAEAGKPLTLARTEVTRALGVLRWAAAESLRYAGELIRLDASATGRPGFGIHQKFPRGPVLGITPFNFPLNLVAHKVAPAIACGCPIMIKPSPYAPLTAIRFAGLFREALPEIPGLVQVLMAGDQLTEALTRAAEVKTISFTGSARVGWMIRAQAPEKPTALELGGNAWVLIGEDTPAELLPKIARRIAAAGFGYAGQSCISVQNIAAAPQILREFTECLSEATQATVYGDPSDSKVVSGPVIHEGAAARIRRDLAAMPSGYSVVKSGAKAGSDPARDTMIVPTLVVGPGRLAPGTLPPLIQEEIFAPVISLTELASLDQAISTINGSRYGLQAGVFTQNLPTIERLYRELDVGGLVVNDVPTTRYDQQPYGGVKDSGLGREGLRYAMDEYCESKFLALSAHAPL